MARSGARHHDVRGVARYEKPAEGAFPGLGVHRRADAVTDSDRHSEYVVEAADDVVETDLVHRSEQLVLQMVGRRRERERNAGQHSGDSGSEGFEASPRGVELPPPWRCASPVALRRAHALEGWDVVPKPAWAQQPAVAASPAWVMSVMPWPPLACGSAMRERTAGMSISVSVMPAISWKHALTCCTRRGRRGRGLYPPFS
jgi:hypothetical protein